MGTLSFQSLYCSLKVYDLYFMLRDKVGDAVSCSLITCVCRCFYLQVKNMYNWLTSNLPMMWNYCFCLEEIGVQSEFAG